MATTYTKQAIDRNGPSPAARKLDSSAPWRWLNKGLRDLKISRLHSIAYGLIFTVAGLLLIWQGPSSPFFTLLLLSGFMLVGPLAAVGLYDISHRIEEGKPPSLLHAISSLRMGTFKLITFALIVGALLLVWVFVTGNIVNAFFGDTDLVRDSWGSLMNSSRSLPFIAIFMLGGLVLALIASAIGIVSIPMASHKTKDMITAGVILLLLFLAWARLTAYLFGLFFDDEGLVAGGWGILLGDEDFLPFIITFVICGGALAAVVFTISVITIPYIAHKHVSVAHAISTSVSVVRNNPLVMAQWAASLAILIIAGMAFFFVGLVVALPIAGHASWHAYREIVADAHE